MSGYVHRDILSCSYNVPAAVLFDSHGLGSDFCCGASDFRYETADTAFILFPLRPRCMYHCVQ